MVRFALLWLALLICAPSSGWADSRGCETLFQAIPLHAQETEFTCGPACARSVLEFILHQHWSEEQFAFALGTYAIGYTPPEYLEGIWASFGLRAQRPTNQSIRDLRQSFQRGESVIVFITLDEIPHYAVLRKISATHIELMDPWVARTGKFRRMTHEAFEKAWTFSLNGRVETGAVLKVWKDI